MYQFVFENFKSKDEFILNNYFDDFNPKISQLKLEEYLKDKIDIMKQHGVVPSGEDDVQVQIDDENNIIKLILKKRGLNFGINVGSDATETNSFSIINPYGYGGKFGLTYGIGLYKTSEYMAFLDDMFGNRLSLSRTDDNPILGQKNFNLKEISLKYSFSILNHSFSIASTKNFASISNENTNKEYLGHTGTSVKTSISHVLKIAINRNFYGRINSEISLPKFSCYPFIKSQVSLTKIIPLNFDMGIRFDGSFGSVFGYRGGKNRSTMIPINDRFFNGKDYHFPGFVNSSICGPSSIPFLGNSMYYSLRATLSKKLNKEVDAVVYYNIGGATLDLGNTVKSSTINDLKSIRSSFGVGLNCKMGPIDVVASFVKPITFKSTDHLENFALEFNLKM